MSENKFEGYTFHIDSCDGEVRFYSEQGIKTTNEVTAELISFTESSGLIEYVGYYHCKREVYNFEVEAHLKKFGILRLL